MSDQGFEQAAERKLTQIFDRLEEEDGFDIDLEGGILTIETEKNGTFLLNKHGPLKEIWLSSPISGAWHFRWSDSEWRGTKDNTQILDDLLTRELSGIAGHQIDFK